MRLRVLGALLVLAACGGGDRSRTVDLLELFPYTDAGQTTARIDFGTPAADAFLRQGWSAATTLPGGASGAWAIARRATVQLAIAHPTTRSWCFAPGCWPRAPRTPPSSPSA